MKKPILIAFSLLLLYAVAHASPFLVCDPQDGVESYEVFSDGNSIGTNIQSEPDGSLRFDLQGVEPGSYEFTLKACNVWGCSEISDPFVSPAATSKPAGLNMIP